MLMLLKLLILLKLKLLLLVFCVPTMPPSFLFFVPTMMPLIPRRTTNSLCRTAASTHTQPVPIRSDPIESDTIKPSIIRLLYLSGITAEINRTGGRHRSIDRSIDRILPGPKDPHDKNNNNSKKIILHSSEREKRSPSPAEKKNRGSESRARTHPKSAPEDPVLSPVPFHAFHERNPSVRPRIPLHFRSLESWPQKKVSLTGGGRDGCRQIKKPNIMIRGFARWFLPLFLFLFRRRIQKPNSSITRQHRCYGTCTTVCSFLSLFHLASSVRRFSTTAKATSNFLELRQDRCVRRSVAEQTNERERRKRKKPLTNSLTQTPTYPSIHPWHTFRNNAFFHPRFLVSSPCCIPF